MTARYFLFLFVFLLAVNVVVAFEVSEYEYFTDVNVHCEEYKGYVRFEIPGQYLDYSSPNSFMDVEHSIERNVERNYYVASKNWFVKEISGQSVSEVEKIFDGDYNSYLVLQSDQSVEFIFENPGLQRLDKVSIDIRDSSIKSIKVYDESGDELTFNQIVNNFHYELLFEDVINADKLRFVLEYDDVLKIKEVSFFSYQVGSESSFVYFYVDNKCNEKFRFYFGEYGEDNAGRGSRSLPVEFSISVDTFKNGDYNNDFDGDSVGNDDDNCLMVANGDQKDINYNQRGDACEDDDKDGTVNGLDNCVDVHNPGQLDGDGDGKGNECDDKDGRFLEENKFLVFMFAGIIALVFVVLSVVLMRKKD
ncbi:hypothetical protein CMI38_02165 [Candidatus Pacearchaeota archaeon]|nr:hypothetical protein [Candidatus Pacearchaeota archaeon]|tara:strand:+ start:8110 stop:9198 length:1089 start_codon:yes stop_codon:yes gene_type:complete